MYCLTKKKHKINAGRFFQSCSYYWFLVCRTEVLKPKSEQMKCLSIFYIFCNLHMYVHISIDIRMLFTKMWKLKNPYLGSSLCVLPALSLLFTGVENETSIMGSRILHSPPPDFYSMMFPLVMLPGKKKFANAIKFTLRKVA